MKKLFNFTNRKFAEEIAKSSSQIKSHWDYTKHSLLPHLYMFKFNKDNIGYVLHEQNTKQLIGIDFGEFDISNNIVTKLEKSLGSKFSHLFTTHSHKDHCGGNEKWKSIRGDNLTIYCGAYHDLKNND